MEFHTSKSHVRRLGIGSWELGVEMENLQPATPESHVCRLGIGSWELGVEMENLQLRNARISRLQVGYWKLGIGMLRWSSTLPNLTFEGWGLEVGNWELRWRTSNSQRPNLTFAGWVLEVGNWD